MLMDTVSIWSCFQRKTVINRYDIVGISLSLILAPIVFLYPIFCLLWYKSFPLALLYIGLISIELLAILPCLLAVGFLMLKLSDQGESRQLAEIVKTAEDAIVATDHRGYLVVWNHACHQLFGYSACEAIGQPITLFCPPELVANQKAYIDRVVTGEVIRDIRTEQITKSGERINVSMTFSPLINGDGQIRGVSGIVRDISQQMALEQNLLEGKELAEASSQAKAQFLANMSHEIRTPMNGIIGMASLLATTALTDSQKTRVKTIQQSGRNLLEILNDILDLSKIEAGKVKLQNTRICIKDVLSDVINLFEATAQQKSLKLHLSLGDRIPQYVMGDDVRLRQIFSNLVGNAIKFTQRGEIVLCVEFLNSSNQMTNLRFEVRDTGIGIPIDKHEKIFELFMQESSQTGRKFGGTGLGLGICRHLVSMMHGQIGLVSDIGVGSTFWLEIPFDAVPDVYDVKAIHSSTFDLERISEDGRRKVLVAEDSPVNQEVIRGMLEFLGHEVDVACDGETALSMMRTNVYDLVLMDIQMPDIDGVEVMNRYRGDLDECSVPIVAITANALMGDAEKYIDLGMDGYISKPFELRDIESKLRDFFLQ